MATGILLGENAWFVSNDGATQGKQLSGSSQAILEAASFFGDQATGQGALRLCLEPAALVVERRNVPPLSARKARVWLRRVIPGLGARSVFAFSPYQTTQQGVRAWVARESDGALIGMRDSLDGRGAPVEGGWPLFALAHRLAVNSPTRGTGGTVVLLVSPTFAACVFVQGDSITEYVPHHYSEDERAIAWRTIVHEWMPLHSGANIVFVSPEPDWATQAWPAWQQIVATAGTTVVDGAKMAVALSGLSVKGGENMLYNEAKETQKALTVLGLVAAACLMIAAGIYGVWGLVVTQATPRRLAAFQAQQNQASVRRSNVDARKAQTLQWEQGIADPNESGATGTPGLLAALQVAPPSNLLIVAMEVEKRAFRIETLWYPPVQITFDQPNSARDSGPEIKKRPAYLDAERQGRMKLRPVTASADQSGIGATVSTEAMFAPAAEYAENLKRAGFAVSPPEPTKSNVAKRWTNSVVIGGKMP